MNVELDRSNLVVTHRPTLMRMLRQPMREDERFRLIANYNSYIQGRVNMWNENEEWEMAEEEARLMIPNPLPSQVRNAEARLPPIQVARPYNESSGRLSEDATGAVLRNIADFNQNTEALQNALARRRAISENRNPVTRVFNTMRLPRINEEIREIQRRLDRGYIPNAIEIPDATRVHRNWDYYYGEGSDEPSYNVETGRLEYM